MERLRRLGFKSLQRLVRALVSGVILIVGKPYRSDDGISMEGMRWAGFEPANPAVAGRYLTRLDHHRIWKERVLGGRI